MTVNNISRERIDALIQKVKASRASVLYQNRAPGTPYHPAEEIAVETADIFEKVAAKVPGTFYHKMDAIHDSIYPCDDDIMALHTGSEMENAERTMEETGRPTLSYNSGMYCFVGYKTQTKNDKYTNLDPAVYLFTDHELADALRREIGEMKEGYVPCSHGERWLNIKSSDGYDYSWVESIERETEKAKANVREHQTDKTRETSPRDI